MKVDLIFTFENREQDWFETNIEADDLTDKKTFFKKVSNELSDEEKADLVKISCCLIGVDEMPSWYNECNGKFFDDEIPQLIKEIWNIESTITPIN